LNLHHLILLKISRILPELISFHSARNQEAVIMSQKDKVLCSTPTPGKQPTPIDRWKYDLVRSAILAAVPSSEQGIEFRALPGLVEQQLEPGELTKLGSVSWYTTTVKLDLEVKGEIERVPGSNPQRLRISK
jgi:hypothetical protein